MYGPEFYEKYDFTEMFGLPKELAPGECRSCLQCLGKYKSPSGSPVTASFMVVCAVCGNKRCPKATFHEYECTGSNEPNQEGSAYQHHNHITRDIKPEGQCPGCDQYYVGMRQYVKELRGES